MAAPEATDPVKLFVAALWSEDGALDAAKRELYSLWGAVDHEGPDHVFDVTDYYEPEMGRGLKRRLFSFEKLVAPDFLVEAKLVCNNVEESSRGPAGGRRVNLDVGYLDHHKVLLGSCKFAGQKVYLDRGIYADLVYRYRGGHYEPFEWTFPDFRDRRYETELLEIRRRYMEQLRLVKS